MYYWEVQNTGTETWWESIAHLRSAANLQVPPEEWPFHGSLRIRTGPARWFFARINQGWLLRRWRPGMTHFQHVPGESSKVCKRHSLGNRFTAHYRSRKLLKTLLCLLFCLFRVIIIIFFFFFMELHLFFSILIFFFFFFCLTALWSKRAVLLAYEVWTCAVAGIVYGQLLSGRAKPHILNICRMHMKNFAGRGGLGRWSGSINCGQETRTIWFLLCIRTMFCN